MLRILGRINGIQADVTKRTCHADKIRRFNARGVFLILLQVPFRRVEVRIQELAKTHDAGGLSNFQQYRFAIDDVGVAVHVSLHGFGYIEAIADVEIESVLVRGGRFPAIRIIDDAVVLESALATSRVDRLKKVELPA
jgi:hypothetical protein